MKKTILFRVGIVLVAVIALSWLPQSALAQRGGGHGGGGGGGFHGGGGGGFHGGSAAAFHGGGGFSGGVHSAYVGGRGYAGYHGGYYGGRGYYGGYHGGYGWGGRAAGIGAEDTVTVDGAGELALAGRIGDGDMDIPMAITTAPGITGLDLITITLPTVLRAILGLSGSRQRERQSSTEQIPTHGLSLTRTDPQDTGRHRHRETYSVRTT